MTKRTAVERVAREMWSLYIAAQPKSKRDDYSLDTHDEETWRGLRALAAWHLAAVTKARGKTVGYVVFNGDTYILGPGVEGTPDLFLSLPLARSYASAKEPVARVVLVPRPRKAR